LCQTEGPVKGQWDEKAQESKQLKSFNEFCGPLKNMKDHWRFKNEQRQIEKEIRCMLVEIRAACSQIAHT